MSHFGPYTPKGMSFDFNFHHVTKIEITAPNICQDFCTREIILHDANGNEIPIKVFSQTGHELPVTIEQDEYEEIF